MVDFQWSIGGGRLALRFGLRGAVGGCVHPIMTVRVLDFCSRCMFFHGDFGITRPA